MGKFHVNRIDARSIERREITFGVGLPTVLLEMFQDGDEGVDMTVTSEAEIHLIAVIIKAAHDTLVANGYYDTEDE